MIFRLSSNRFILKIALLILLIIFVSNCMVKEKERNVFHFEKMDGVLSLHGNWEISTNSHYDPITHEPKEDFFIDQLPKMWFSAGIKNRYIVSYNTLIQFPEHQTEDYGLLVFNVINSHEVYINGNLIGQKGIISVDKDKMQTNARPSLYKIPKQILNQDKNRITIRVGDIAGSGGFLEAPRLCEWSVCEKKYYMFLLLTSGTAIFMFFIGLLHVFMFFSNQNEKSLLYFGLGVISHAFTYLGFERIIYFFSDTFLIHFFSMNLGYTFSCLFSILFIHSFLEIKFQRVSKFLLACFSLSSISTLIASYSVNYRSFHSREVLIFNLFFLAPLLFGNVLYLSLKAFKEKKIGSKLILFGFLILVITNVLIPLHIWYIIPTKAFTLGASIVLITCVTIALSYKSRESRDKLIKLEQNYNVHLGNEVKIKTNELEKKNNELLESNRMRDKLFSILAHDLRNPLNALEEVLFLFNNKYLSHKQLQMNAATLRENLENNKFLLENILQWSLTQLGIYNRKWEEVDVKNLIMEVVKIYRPIAEKKNITIVLIEKKTFWAPMESGIIQLALRNLISNSIKFTPRGGNIKISYSKKNSYPIIVVQDNGVGISKDNVQKILRNKELKKNSNGTENELGSGLGLSFCHDFLGKIGWSIGMKSRLGKGSKFWITIKDHG